MKMRCRCHLAVILGAAIVWAGGCLERAETIDVGQDGSVRIEASFKGKGAEFNKPFDPLPSSGGPWSVREERSGQPGSEQEIKITAVREVKAWADLPDRFSHRPADPGYQAGLRFPTRIWTELRADGLYVHFRRVYVARVNRRFNWPRERLTKDEDLQKFLKTPQQQWTQEQRQRFVEALVEVETQRQMELIAAAADDMGEAWPQHWGLLLQQAARNHAGVANTRATVQLMAEPPSPARDARLGALGQDLISGFVPALEAAMTDLGMGDAEQRTYLDKLERQRNALNATEDLGDEQFLVRVRLPGTPVAHNGQEIDPDGYIVWKFTGESLMDRHGVLMASSVLPLPTPE